MKESENILRIFEETKNAIQKEDSVKLKDLSNQTIHTASVYQDPDNVAVAVIVYSLSKIIERQYHKQPKGQRFLNSIILLIDNLIIALQKKDEAKFKQNLELIRKTINKLSGKLKIYIQDVLEKRVLTRRREFMSMGFPWKKPQSFWESQCLNLQIMQGRQEFQMYARVRLWMLNQELN